MSLLNHLQFQEIDPSEDIADEKDHFDPDDDITLSDSVDEASLEKFWDKVVEDIHDDPDWYVFSDNQ